MSRSALAVTLVLLILAGAFLFRPGTSPDTSPEATPVPLPEASSATGTATGNTGPERPPAQRPPPSSGVPVLAGTADLVRFLDGQGLAGRALVEAWRQWRLDRGLLGADALSGVEQDNEQRRYYAALDPATLEELGRAGDGVAYQVLADSQPPGEISRILELHSLASLAGSAGAMLALAAELAAPATTDASEPAVEAMAWRLAALRRYGPAVADPDLLGGLRTQAGTLPANVLDRACARSLAILADLSVGGSEPPQPAAFVAPAAALEGLPCADTAAPVTLPRALRSCGTAPAEDSSGRPVEIWVCNGS